VNLDLLPTLLMIAVGVALTVVGVAGGLAGMHLMLILIPIGLAATVLGLLDYIWFTRGSEPTPLMLLAILLGEAAATLAIIIIEGWV
jgi:hypothetical protein